MFIHVLAEQATLGGTSNHPGYLPGFGILPAESVREFGHDRTAQATDNPFRGARAGVSALGGIGGVRALARFDVPMAGM